MQMPMQVDIWEQNFVQFHQAMRTPSEYGAFEPPMLRHEMALYALRDTLWYAEARADPKKHLPRFYSFIERDHVRQFTPQMTSQKRADLITRGNAFLEAAEASHLIPLIA